MQGPGPLLGRAQREPGLHLALARRPGGLGERLAVVGDLLGVGVLLGAGQPCLELPEPFEVLRPGLLRLGDRPLEPLGLAAGGPGLGAELAELLGHGGERRVGLVQLGEGDVDALLGLVPLPLQAGHVEAEPLGRRDRLGQLLGRLVDRGLDLDEAGLAGRAAGGDVGAEQVAVAGHRGQRGVAGDQRPRRGEVVDDGHPVEQPRQRGTHGLGAGDHVEGVRRALGQRRPAADVVGRAGAEHQAGPAEVVLLEVADRGDRGVGVLEGDGVGGAAEGAGHGGLEAAADGEQRGHRAEQPGDLVGGGEQGAGAVLAVEAELEGVLAGGERAAVALGALRLLAGLGQPLLEVVELGGGRLVLGVEPLLAGVEPGDPGLEGGEVAAGPGRRG